MAVLLCGNQTKINSTDLISNNSFCTDNNTDSSILMENFTPPLIIIINTIIGCVGIIGNLSVIIVFGKEEKFRRKIPNIFIINQVGLQMEFCYYQLT